ncbi:MAG TPA: glycosyltransferase [Dehalococcoidia bacterium]|nr:glycosyltransferase [Dehalococcoidia bacterium]
MTETSVVICTWTEDRWNQLAAAVASVQAQTEPASELIVVVDHNAPLYERVRREHPGVVAVQSSEPRGAAGSKNSGIAHARGEFVAFLDDDAAAEPDWLARLREPFADPRVLGVGGTAAPVWESTETRWFPPEFNWIVGCSYAGLPRGSASVRNVFGCNMAFRAETLRSLGGFRHELGRVCADPLGCEETEFCIRLVQRWPGSLLMHEPRARVRHQVPAARSTWRYFRQRCYAEGISKAHVIRLVGARSGLESERRFAASVLPAAALRALAEGLRRRDGAALARSGAIVAGLTITTAGFLTGAATGRLSRRSGPRQATAPSLPGGLQRPERS